MTRAALLGLALVALAACNQDKVDEISRKAAGHVIKPVVQAQLPGVPTDAAVDCVLENATDEQVLALAADAVGGPTASTKEVVASIIAKPEALRCLVNAGAPLIMNRS